MLLSFRGDSMGSAVMHLCIGKKIAQKLNNSERKEFLIGNLAPDLSKLTNQSKYVSHFLKKININDAEREVPDLDKFLKKYKNRLNEPFIQGYLCHLISDDIWFRDYIPNHVVSITEDKSQVLLRDIDDYIPYDDFKKMMYGDYAKIHPYIFSLYKINLRKFDDMNIEDPNMEEFEYEEIHKLIEQISYYLDYVETKEAEDEVEFDDNRMDDYDDKQPLELLSNTEVITYIEEAIDKVTEDYKELGLIKE